VNYLAKLTFRFLSAVSRLDDSRRKALRTFFLAAQSENGGFTGRQGEGDLYYTGFALRGLFLLGALDDPELLRRVSGFLDDQAPRPLSAVESASFVFCSPLVNGMLGRETSQEQKERILYRWKHFRCADGCYATSEKTAYSSTYQTFLAATVFEQLGAEEEKNAIPVEPILDRQRSDGGFVELAPLRRSGTNPTAAAAAFLAMRAAESRNRNGMIDFLLARQTSEGGFTANTQIPVPDLLSSFTAVVALFDLQAEERYDRSALRQFVLDSRSPDGGYFGAPWDRQSDVEYGFYGLALEALSECL